MKNKGLTRWLAIVSLAVAGSFNAHAATVTFSDMASGNGSPVLFDVDGSIVSGDELNIGLNAFTAVSAPGAPVALVDSFTVTITAAPGRYISTLDYQEIYNYSAPNGVTAITLSVIANGNPSLPAAAAFTGSTGDNVVIAIPTIVFGPCVESVTLSISNSLFAFGLGQTASIGKDMALLSVTTVPLPPAIGLLGAALIGLATVSSRRNRTA
jgi:hypothetical protein